MSIERTYTVAFSGTITIDVAVFGGEDEDEPADYAWSEANNALSSLPLTCEWEVGEPELVGTRDVRNRVKH